MEPRPRRIVVHDYAGHPFQVQLSRSLARRRHEVLHLYCTATLTPRGRLERVDGDPDLLTIRPVHLSVPIRKRALLHRWVQEVRYGRVLVKEVAEFRPEVVLSGNTPLEAQRPLLRHCRQTGCRFVYWVQDLYGVAAHRVLRRRLPVLGALVGRHYMALERQLIASSDAVVLISEDFRAPLGGCLPPGRRTQVVPNWAPLSELTLERRDNHWAHQHGLVGRRVLMYTGTLGPKQHPGLLLALALRYRERHDVRVVVVSEGDAVDWLRERVAEHRLTNVRLLPFQPFEQLPDVLASADVLVALLEAEAGDFAVPSKILTYLCAGKPVLAAVPATNQAARVLAESGAGILVPPGDEVNLVRAADGLLEDEAKRADMGHRGRRYAERMFDIERITDDFEQLLTGRCSRTAGVTQN